MTTKRNRARCAKCNTIIESKYRHDFQSCKCGAIFVDGGMSYYRCGFDVPSSFIHILDDDTEEVMTLPPTVEEPPPPPLVEQLRQEDDDVFAALGIQFKPLDELAEDIQIPTDELIDTIIAELQAIKQRRKDTSASH